jgi:hypothetical protein
MRFTKYILALALTLAPIANASEVLQSERRAGEGSAFRHTIDGVVEDNDAAIASDGANFLIVWIDGVWFEGIDRGLHAMVVGPRGNIVVPQHRLATGLSHARPAVAWTGDSYLVLSIDMQIPRRIVAHQVDATGQLISNPPAVVTQETRSETFQPHSVIWIAASGDAVYACWEAYTFRTAGLYYGLVRLDRSGAVQKQLPLPTVNTESIATDGSTVFLGQSRGCNAYPECVPGGGDLLTVPDSPNEAPRVTAVGIIETSLASSPAGVLYIDERLGRRPRLVRGDVQLAGDVALPFAAQRTAWTGSSFLTVWGVEFPHADGDLSVSGAWVTPNGDAALSVTQPFIIGHLPLASSRILAIAGNNRGTALILGYNRDNSIEWMTVSQTPRRTRAIRR